MTVKITSQRFNEYLVAGAAGPKNYWSKGKSKAEILKETGATIGVDRANFESRIWRNIRYMGLSGSE